MAQEEKPYRVYRGGRAKGKVPAVPGKAKPKRGDRGSVKAGSGRSRRFPLRLRRPRSWKHVTLIALLALLVLTLVWAVTGYLAFRGGVSDANKRLDPNARAALAKSSGLLLTHATTILLLGTDTSTAAGRSGDRHADSIIVIRTDPSHHRLAYLSIPRDLLVPVPGVGNTKINASFQAGGAALAIKTVHAYTGIPIDHVVIVDFNSFKDLIDAEGGVTIDVPEPILSNRFDCPYATQQRCLQWPGWRFHKGTPAHERRAGADLLADPREPAQPRRERPHPRRAPASRRAGRDREAHLAMDASQAALRRRLADQAAHDRPLGERSDRARLGQVPRLVVALALLPARRRRDERRRRVGDHPVRGQREGARDVGRRLGPQPPTTTYGPGCRAGHPLQ